jgi:predicted ATP-grasp superfamily ATP-dependent carboligase
MHEGKPIRQFQHIRIAEWPPEGGFSSVCDAVPLTEHLELQAQSIALLKAIGWEGVAMVEYRYDPKTRRAVLMEINGRYWGSYPLAMHSGANFALISYYLNSGLGIPNLSEINTHLRCRMIVTEIKRLVRILFQNKLIVDRSFKTNRTVEVLQFISNYIRPNVRYYVWAIFDPAPFFADTRNLIIKIFSK